jgi:hypothetical protein
VACRRPALAKEAQQRQGRRTHRNSIATEFAQLDRHLRERLPQRMPPGGRS